MTRLTLLLPLPLFTLGACAGATPPPAIALDSVRFQAAVREAEPAKPVEIVTVPQPLPLPGQMVPPPSVAKEAGPPTARVETANRAATREPSSAGYINAMQVYPWTDGALYRLYAAPERVSDVALQPGEKLLAVAAGDTVRWVIGDTTSGSGDDARIHVLVKPFAPGLVTNMVIATDRRAYHLALESTDRTAMAAISWTYPQDRLLALQRQNQSRSRRMSLWPTCALPMPLPATIHHGARFGRGMMGARSISNSRPGWIKARRRHCSSSARVGAVNSSIIA